VVNAAKIAFNGRMAKRVGAFQIAVAYCICAAEGIASKNLKCPEKTHNPLLRQIIYILVQNNGYAAL
jgi:hypothetical protein